MINRGLYVHVPFCSRKCNYCDFYSVAIDTENATFYTKKVIEEIEDFSTRFPESLIKTIYIGGGTPSILPIELLEKIVSKIYSSFKCDIDEFTIEVNPAEISYVNQYNNLGIDRISVGIQSLDDMVLDFSGRRHNSKTALESLAKLNSLFSNISCDLIIGLPFENDNNFINSLTILSKYVSHFSLYILKIADSTKFFSIHKDNPLLFPLEDNIAELYIKAKNMLDELGYHRYEISNFSKDGFESLHNLSYWKSVEYFGVGPSAASLINNERIIVPQEDYFINSRINRKVEEVLSLKDQMIETAILSLRLDEGIDIHNFENKFKVNFYETFMDAVNKNRNYLNITNEYIKVRDEYSLTQNQILIDFLQ